MEDPLYSYELFDVQMIFFSHSSASSGFKVKTTGLDSTCTHFLEEPTGYDMHCWQLSSVTREARSGNNFMCVWALNEKGKYPNTWNSKAGQVLAQPDFMNVSNISRPCFFSIMSQKCPHIVDEWYAYWW